MKKLLVLLACAALLCGHALAEGAIWVDDDMTLRYHATEKCALAAKNLLESHGPASEYYPCQACVAEDGEQTDPQCTVRGGTAIVRLSDDWLRRTLAEGTRPGEIPDALIHLGGTDDEDLARLVHGRDYVRLLEGQAAGSSQRAEALVPEYAGDGLLMSCRHLGAAWYLAVRPEGGVGERLELPLRLWRAELQIDVYPAGIILSTEGAECRETTLTLSPVKSSGEVIWQRDDGMADQGETVIRDGSLYTLVLRLHYCDPDDPDDPGLNRLACYGGEHFALNGYMDGDDGVFVAALTRGEVYALRQKIAFSAYEAPVWRTDHGEPADPAQSEPDYAPVSKATLPDGTVAELTSDAYPVGTPLIAWVLTRPGGGVASYWNRLSVQWLHDGMWYPLGDSTLWGRVDGDENRRSPGWFCDRVSQVWPIEGFGALREGLYRVLADVTWVEQEDRNVYTWLEFRVTPDAPQPSLPAPSFRFGPDFELPVHATPHDDPATYNSCTDTTRAWLSGAGWRLLAGDVVYELRGIDDSWGWGILGHYSLFAYPAGQPERAVMLIDDFDHKDMRLFDLGDGLLLVDGDTGFWRCDLDGGNLRSPGRAFSEDDALNGGLAGTEDRTWIKDVLPVGGQLYLATAQGVWVTGPDELRPRLVYRAKRDIQNGEDSGSMVYAEGRLFVADGGIVVLDALRPGADGQLPARRLTENYDPEDGGCGLGYIVLNGRLYCWDEDKKATVSMDLDGGDLQTVSKEHYWFNGVSQSGTVLALTGTEEGLFGDERTAAAFYYPIDPADPTFDPDHCEKRDIAPGEYDTFLGDWIVRMDDQGNETWERGTGNRE